MSSNWVNDGLRGEMVSLKQLIWIEWMHLDRDLMYSEGEFVPNLKEATARNWRMTVGYLEPRSNYG